MAGLFVFALSAVLMIKADLGVGPWDVFHLGLARLLGRPYGQMSILVGLAVIVLSYALAHIKPGPGTVANMFFIGFFADRIMPYVPKFHGLTAQLAVFAAGVLLMGLATRVYIGAGLGAGPRDGLMLGMSRLTGRSIRIVRTAIEIGVLAAGTLLGGKVGLGTLLFALGIGPAVQLFFRLLGDPAATKREPA